MDAEVIDRNPCAGVSIPPDRAGEKLHKEAFTLDEIRYMIEHFPPLWSSAVRCSFETFGQRLGDILRVNWNQFDWERRVVRFDTGKAFTSGRLPAGRKPGNRWTHCFTRPCWPWGMGLPPSSGCY